MDVVSATLQAEAQREPVALSLAFAAGVLTSVGPCVAPRLIAVLSLGARRSRTASMLAATAFVFGLCAAYAAWGVATGWVWRAVGFSTLTYALLAVALSVAGARRLLYSEECHRHGPAEIPAPQLGAAFLLGVSMALTLSPCCTPIIVGTATYVSQSGALWTSAVLVAFALGHAMPVIVAAAGGAGIARALSSDTARYAVRTIGGSLFLALGAYYAVLA